jgi:hypothetical protein
MIDLDTDPNPKRSLRKFYARPFYHVCDFCHMTNYEYVKPGEQAEDGKPSTISDGREEK